MDVMRHVMGLHDEIAHLESALAALDVNGTRNDPTPE